MIVVIVLRCLLIVLDEDCSVKNWQRSASVALVARAIRQTTNLFWRSLVVVHYHRVCCDELHAHTSPLYYYIHLVE